MGRVRIFCRRSIRGDTSSLKENGSAHGAAVQGPPGLRLCAVENDTQQVQKCCDHDTDKWHGEPIQFGEDDIAEQQQEAKREQGHHEWKRNVL